MLMRPMGTNLGSLEDGLWFKVLVMSRVLNVRFDPADILTASKTPLLQTLHNHIQSYTLSDPSQLPITKPHNKHEATASNNDA